MPGATITESLVTVLVRPVVVDLAVAAGADVEAVRAELPVLALDRQRRRDRLPGHRQLAEPPAARTALDRPARVAQRLDGGDEALHRAVDRQRAGARPAASSAGEQVVHPLAGHVAVDERLRQPLRDDDGGSRPASRSEIVKRAGPVRLDVDPGAIRPISSHVPSTSSPPGARRAASAPRRRGTSVSSYCRSTFIARMITGRSPPGVGTSKPPRREGDPLRARDGSAAATRSGSISRPSTRTSGRTRREAIGELERRPRPGAVAEVDHERCGARRSAGSAAR